MSSLSATHECANENGGVARNVTIATSYKLLACLEVADMSACEHAPPCTCSDGLQALSKFLRERGGARLAIASKSLVT